MTKTCILYDWTTHSTCKMDCNKTKIWRPGTLQIMKRIATTITAAKCRPNNITDLPLEQYTGTNWAQSKKRSINELDMF